MMLCKNVLVSEDQAEVRSDLYSRAVTTLLGPLTEEFEPGEHDEENNNNNHYYYQVILSLINHTI